MIKVLGQDGVGDCQKELHNFWCFSVFQQCGTDLKTLYPVRPIPNAAAATQ